MGLRKFIAFEYPNLFSKLNSQNFKEKICFLFKGSYLLEGSQHLFHFYSITREDLANIEKLSANAIPSNQYKYGNLNTPTQ